MPAMLVADSAWPMLAFSDASAQNPVSAVCCAKAWVMAATSRLSPICVPVPWPSMKPMLRAGTPAWASACAMTCACAFGLGVA